MFWFASEPSSSFKIFCLIAIIRIHHEYEIGIEKIRSEDHRLAKRGLPSDDR